MSRRRALPHAPGGAVGDVPHGAFTRNGRRFDPSWPNGQFAAGPKVPCVNGKPTPRAVFLRLRFPVKSDVMSDLKYRPEVEILCVTGTGRRRRWTDAHNVRIFEESFGPRGRLAETARRHDVGRTLLVRWRRQYRDGELSGGAAPLRFMPVTLVPSKV